MSQLGMRLMGSRNALLSVYSTAGAAALHLVHYLSAPILMGSATEMHAHHMSGQASSGEGSSLMMNILMLLLFVVNLVSMYFAARQLNEAYRQRSQFTKHTMLCSSISLLILAVGIYTIITL
ncbi:hypothetical protein DFQ01_12648 [Paenibacillus cellulosilyticus]|uniref:Uncharacterized protein n=1 Tax=Paenibacillus cellulosilyticus TaxID=375489 RepID=A0A2V2YWI8_9BACL|nr:hypothetical protein [Paenibacillus cellulosilyticus]PWV95577.1 hypothetical protein DFQ01_12648 [Paenibacillus cellulosilyticus]QKS47350.1 hypothetical protein HUB94_23405 [Paenibacillus cellulosilyticus]